MILPPAQLGVLGGGQLGRMFTMAARTMGYRVCVFDPDPASPAAAVADRHIRAQYDDVAALDAFGQACVAFTTEFENVPAAALRRLANFGPVRPGAAAVEVAQDRLREKGFARDHGLATAEFAAVRGPDDLAAAWAQVGGPAILKTASLGYDGKGQRGVEGPAELAAAFTALGGVSCILERRLSLRAEVSVLLARAEDGAMALYPPAENRHRDGILDRTLVPAGLPEAAEAQALDMAGRLAVALDYVGILAVEFFLTTDGRVLFNELAPRPHNSGHYTVDASVTSQFEQQVRVLCGLPPGDTRLLSPVVMVNLLGDLWARGEPAWGRLLGDPRAKLHLYGKDEARVGRKMGHYNCLAMQRDQAEASAEAVWQSLLAGRATDHAE